MNLSSFQVGDKVALKPAMVASAADMTVPVMAAGRVYCVERINYLHGNQWLRLVGLKERKRKCCDDRGVFAGLMYHVGRRAREEAV